VSRGSLRIYLGAAPGVGKTFAMLNEGRRRAARGTDVVDAYVETHGRQRTIEQIGDLEVVPRRRVEYRGASFEEMDLDAVLARHPEVALVDELAHTNVPGVLHEKRWQDVETLLDAGIDVLSTVNIQHLESLNDVVEGITGITQRETIPDDVVRAAQQVQLVDSTPEELRRRMAHGNIYAPEKVDAALANYFRTGNLSALRELALLWVADKVDVGLEEYRERHGITEPWETRERIVVALTGAPGTEHLVRRAARIAQRVHGELVGVHVRSEEGLVGQEPDDIIADRRDLLVAVGGTFVEIVGNDVAAALVSAARAENATQIVLGASRRSRWAEITRGSVINRVVRLSGAIDVHVISQEAPAPAMAHARRRRLRAPESVLPPRRRAIAWGLGAAGVPLLTMALASARDSVGLPTALLLYLGLTVAVAAVGGTLPALLVAVAGFLCANWYFTPPFHRWTVGEAENVLALVVFLGVAVLVSAFVVTAARRAFDAARASAEAETLAALAATSASPDPLPILVEHLRSSFALDGVALVDREAGEFRTIVAAGDDVPTSAKDADLVEGVGPHLVLALRGGAVGSVDRRVLRAFAASLASAVERRRLTDEAGHAEELAEANELRSALLQAVSHDLRTPLASIKASVSSLRQGDVTWTADDTSSFLTTIEEETDRLTRLVVNLLDMSRVSAGALRPALRPVGIDEVLPSALAGLGTAAAAIRIDTPADLRPALADPALLERVLANVVENAIVHGAPPVCVSAGVVGERIHVRVEDRGPGIPRGQRNVVLQPFQRAGDETPGGVGLGLAVASGFVRAMGGDLHIEDTPGGGATVVVELDTA
jgi:two-component system sensor histidine kinase KdpD